MYQQCSQNLQVSIYFQVPIQQASLIGCTVTSSSVIQIYSFFSWFLCKRKYCSWVLIIIGNHSQYELGSTLPYGRPFLTPYRALRQWNLDLHQTSPLYHGENGIEVWRRYIYICNIYIYYVHAEFLKTDSKAHCIWEASSW